MKNLLFAPKDPREVARAKAKMRKEAELAERLKLCRNFVLMWNRWRDFYLNLSAVEPKTSAQVTAIENAIAFAKEHELDINMMIACVHRAFRKRKFRPNYTNLYDDKALDIYDSNYDHVLADTDRAEATHSSLRGIDE